MEGKNSGSGAGKFRYYRRKRRGTHRRSHNSFSPNACSETFSGCYTGCYGKLYSRRFLGIFELELQWISYRSLRGNRRHSQFMMGWTPPDGIDVAPLEGGTTSAG